MFGITYREIATLVITYALYATWLLGLWFVFGKEIIRYGRRKKRSADLKERLTGKGKVGWFQIHMETILMAAFAGRVTVRAFQHVSCLCMAAAAFLSAGRYTWAQSMLFMGIAGMMPYLICRMLAETQRGASSNEAEALLSVLLSEYRVRAGNILEALEATMIQVKELKASRRFLFLLITGLQNAKNDKMRLEATEAFACALGTNWGRLLAANVGSAVCQGTEISLSLEDILLQIKDARHLSEERKRLNSESVRMVKTLIPGAYVGSLYLGVKFSGIGWSCIFANQFGTREGVFLFFLIVCTFLANTMLIAMIRSKRFDF